MNYINNFLFGYFPYICLTVFFLGSLIRFDRDQYTWKSDSSQLLRAGQLRLGSNLLHIGVLVLFFGHLFGMLTPHVIYEYFVSASTKQLLAMVVGGVAGVLALVGTTLLMHRRLFDPRIRINSKPSDILILFLLWLQLALGMVTIIFSSQHMDGGMMMQLAGWAQHIVTFRAGAPEMLEGVNWVFKTHMVLGMSLFLIFPFTRLVHVWSGFGIVAYLIRPYQIVRARRLNLPKNHANPTEPGNRA